MHAAITMAPSSVVEEDVPHPRVVDPERGVFLEDTDVGYVAVGPGVVVGDVDGVAVAVGVALGVCAIRTGAAGADECDRTVGM